MSEDICNGLRTQSGRNIECINKSEGGEEIIRANGSHVLGYIDNQIALAIKSPEGEIRANVGFFIHAKERGHIKEICNAGYNDPLIFLQGILDNWMEIKEGNNNSFWLIRPLQDKHNGVIVLKNTQNENLENIYKISTLMYVRERNIRNKKTLYTGHPATVNSSGSAVNLTAVHSI